jgi:hypothetical protein
MATRETGREQDLEVLEHDPLDMANYHCIKFISMKRRSISSAISLNAASSEASYG